MTWTGAKYRNSGKVPEQGQSPLIPVGILTPDDLIKIFLNAIILIQKKTSIIGSHMHIM